MATDSWGENTITFNNRPAAAAAELGNWALFRDFPCDGAFKSNVARSFSTPALTSQVQQELDSDGKLSLRIEGNGHWLRYYSREEGNAAFRPQLVVTFDTPATQASVDAIEAKLDDGTTGLQALDDDLAAIEAKLDDGTKGLRALADDLGAIEAKLDDGTKGLQALDDDLGAIEAKLDDGTKGLGALDDDLSAIEAKLDDGTSGLQALGEDLGDIDAALVVVESKLDDGTSGLQALDEDLGDIDTALVVVESKLDFHLDRAVDTRDVFEFLVAQVLELRRVHVQVIQIEEKKTYVLGVTEAGVPLTGVQLVALRAGAPKNGVAFNDVTTTVVQLAPGVLEVTITGSLGGADSDTVFQWRVKHEHGGGNIHFGTSLTSGDSNSTALGIG